MTTIWRTVGGWGGWYQRDHFRLQTVDNDPNRFELIDDATDRTYPLAPTDLYTALDEADRLIGREGLS